MANEDGSVWVTYNGELYNEPGAPAHGSRRRATSTGPAPTPRAWSTSTRSEGDGFRPPRSTGCSPWRSGTARRGRLVLARDRMGQKPLFYAATPGGGLVFGSEPKALLAHPEIARRLDPGGLARYLFYEYVPAPHSIWEGCKKLPRGARPGLGRRHDGRSALLAARRHRGRGRAPPFEASGRTVLGRVPRGGGAAPAVATCRSGVFLSGGVDSSSVAAALTRARAGAGRPDVLDRVRGPELRREPARPRGRPAPGDRPPRADLLGRDGLRAAARGRGLARRAVRRRLDPADAPPEPVRAGRGHRRARAATAPTSCWPAIRRSPPSGRPGSSAGCRARRGPWPGRRSAACRSITATSASTSSSSSSSAARPSPRRWRTSAGSGSFSGPEIARLVDRRRHRRRGRAPGPRRGAWRRGPTP